MGEIIYWKKGEIPEEHKNKVTNEDMLFGEWVCADERVEKISFYGMGALDSKNQIYQKDLSVCITFKNGDTHSRILSPPYTYENKVKQAEQYLKQLK